MLVEQIDVPHNEGSCREIVGSLALSCLLCRRSVVALAPDFHREDGRSLEKLHSGRFSYEEGRIGAE